MTCLLMTSHLERLSSEGDERMKQLKMAFKRMRDAPDTETVLFGCDLSLRDSEVSFQSLTAMFSLVNG